MKKLFILLFAVLPFYVQAEMVQMPGALYQENRNNEYLWVCTDVEYTDGSFGSVCAKVGIESFCAVQPSRDGKTVECVPGA